MVTVSRCPDLIVMRAHRKAGLSYAEMAAMYGVSVSRVRQVARRRISEEVHRLYAGLPMRERRRIADGLWNEWMGGHRGKGAR